MATRCPKCKNSYLFEKGYCAECGVAVEPMPKCKKCGAEIWRLNKFCEGCGVSRKEALGITETKKLGFWNKFFRSGLGLD